MSFIRCEMYYRELMLRFKMRMPPLEVFKTRGHVTVGAVWTIRQLV
jgi:hypothetical protein